jgi:hypothetical protein
MVKPSWTKTNTGEAVNPDGIPVGKGSIVGVSVGGIGVIVTVAVWVGASVSEGASVGTARVAVLDGAAVIALVAGRLVCEGSSKPVSAWQALSKIQAINKKNFKRRRNIGIPLSYPSLDVYRSALTELYYIHHILPHNPYTGPASVI